MESDHNRMLLICALLLVFLEYGSALKCYICNSTQTACGVTFDAKKSQKFIQDCPQQIHEPVCRKEMHIPNGNAEAPEHRHLIVQRGCADHSPYKRLCYDIETAGHTLSVCECRDNLCNGTANGKATKVYIYVTFLVLFCLSGGVWV